MRPIPSTGRSSTTWTTVNTAEAMPGVQTPLGELRLGPAGARHARLVLRHRRPAARRGHGLGGTDERYAGIVYGRFIGNVDKLRDIGDRMRARAATPWSSRCSATSPRAWRRATRPAATRRRREDAAPDRAAAEADRPHARRRPRVVARRRGIAQPRPAALSRVMRPHCSATMLAQAVYEQVRALAEAAGRPGSRTP